VGGKKGPRILEETSVERIVHRRGKVQELLCENLTTGEPLRIRARQVVLSGGAINSSALLLKSGITKNVGTRLSFNAMVMMTAEFEETLDAFDGDQMTMYYKGDGFVVEPTHNPLMAAALTTPGCFQEHGDLMKKQRHLAYCGVLVGTEPVGRVVHSLFFGHEETRFRPTEKYLNCVRSGLKEVASGLLEAGAKRVFLPKPELNEIRSRQQIGQIDEAVSDVRRILYGSSHPMGGNPWSEDPKRGVVDKDLAVHGFENLHIADASVFPSCIGVNPIETIMAVSEYGARRIRARA
jgi:choline dehydrogenase-like flavoprotein